MSIATHYQGHSDNVFAVAWAPDGDAIASGSRDRTVQVWHPLTGTPITIYRKHSHSLLAVAWSPDGRHIASGCTAGSVRVWQAFGDDDIVNYTGHKRFARSVAWSPGGAYIASGGDYGDSTVQVWEAVTGKHIYTHTGQYRIFAVNWSPDGPSSSPSYLITSRPERVPRQGGGSRIASASFDGSVQIWDAVHGDILLSYGEHTGPVYAL